MKNNIVLSLIFLMIVALAFKVSATVGVTSFYYENNPLIVNPGEVKDIMFTLQNHGGDADAVVRVELAAGSEIAELTDENLEYNVPLDSDGIPVPMRITIPENAKPGDQWSVGASFSIKYKPKGAGSVQLSSTYFKDFKVIVKEPSPTTQATRKTDLLNSPLTSFIFLIVILVVLILLIKLLSRKK